ncbi:tetratricopeptide repeat protein [Maribacter sp. R86514]|uniref:tetratricopeptide repeat protein n=1 Tax=Maribacter sp. R86514 TaxID=3093854 RepID=UPI0037CA8848
MKKVLSICLFFLLFSGFTFGQTKEIDSLKMLLNTANLHDTIKIRTNLNIASKYARYSLDSLKKYTTKAVDLSKVNNDYLLGEAYSNFGGYYDNIGKLELSKEYYSKAMTLIDSVTATKKFARVLSNYATLLNETTELDKKIAYNQRALKLRETIDDKFQVGISQFNLAILYSDTDFDSLSVKYLKLALKNGEISNEKLFTGYVINSLIMYTIRKENLIEAKEYLLKSEDICKETGSNKLCYNTYTRKGEYLDHFKKV